MHELVLEKFSGPLELLLNLVEKKKLSINEISLSEVAEQYIAHIKTLEEASKEELAYFLVIASTLMLIKSRSLIPTLKLSEEEEVDIKDLEERLKIYKFFKDLSLKLENIGKQKQHLFSREAYLGIYGFFSPPESINAEILKKTLLNILEFLPKKEDLPEEVIERAISLEEKMGELKERLEKSFSYIFSGTFHRGKEKKENKAEIIVGFLAMLELIKQGFLVFEQKDLFDNIEIKKHE